MTLKGTGHGLSTDDKVKAVAVEFVCKRFATNGVVEVEAIEFDGTYYHVLGRYTIEKITAQQFVVRLDKDGDIIEVTHRPSKRQL